MSVGVKIGKAKVYIDVRGCVDCGTEYAEAWLDAGEITVKVGGRHPVSLAMARCGECAMEAVNRHGVVDASKGA